jgi:hypothetical protein
VAQKQIILNNLAVRRATEELSSAEDFASLCNILESAFAANEFDSFDLAFRPATRDHARIPAPFTRNYDGTYRLEWRKKQAVPTDSRWQLSLLLNNPLLVPDATFTVYRGHVSSNLMFDINLLTNEFQTVLSDALPDALPRALGTSAEASISWPAYRRIVHGTRHRHPATMNCRAGYSLPKLIYTFALQILNHGGNSRSLSFLSEHKSNFAFTFSFHPRGASE